MIPNASYTANKEKENYKVQTTCKVFNRAKSKSESNQCTYDAFASHENNMLVINFMSLAQIYYEFNNKNAKLALFPFAKNKNNNE